MAGPQKGHLDRPGVAVLQGERLRSQLAEILPRNRFYAASSARRALMPPTFGPPADLARLPFTTKAELLADQESASALWPAC